MTADVGPCLATGDRVVVVGIGVTGRAVTVALARRGFEVVAVDDAPSREALDALAAIGVEESVAPDAAGLRSLMSGAVALLPTPGLPDAHPAFHVARSLGVGVMSELDLARMWDDRPVVAITGTDGKTTVTTMVTEMLRAGGRSAEAVGNTEVPLVEAIDDPTTEVFVVEASSFRLGHSAFFAPEVATWLNFEADHLDVHSSIEAYEAAKATIWRDQSSSQTAVGNAEDEVVMRNMTGRARKLTFGLREGDNRVVEGRLVVDGSPLIAIESLARSLPHDVSNALAAATTAAAIGVKPPAIAEVLATFEGLPHRLQLVGGFGGVDYYDDSKATTPHAVLSALSAFDSAVLIAGGRNKGVDLGKLAQAAPRLRHVIAIGEAAGEVVDAFEGHVAVTVAYDMSDAVGQAVRVARPGDAVILSPACASFDWYRNYGERGDDFARIVRELQGDGS